MARLSVVPYQFTFHTSKAPEHVLDELAARGLVGIDVAERGSSYIVLGRKPPRYHVSTDIAIAAGIAILLAVLILTAITPVFIILLPAALVPAVPSYLDRSQTLAVSAVYDAEEAATRVTVHGQATSELAAALDAYLGTLPPATPPAKTPELQPVG